MPNSEYFINAGRGELLSRARADCGGDISRGVLVFPSEECDGMGGYAESRPKPDGRSGKKDIRIKVVLVAAETNRVESPWACFPREHREKENPISGYLVRLSRYIY